MACETKEDQLVNVKNEPLCPSPTEEQTHGPSRPLWNSPAPFIWCTTPADELISVSHECGQWQDEMSSTLISGVNESEHVDDKGEVDMFCDLLSRHVNDVGSEVFADEVDDTKAQNSWDQLTNSCTGSKNTGTEEYTDNSHLRRHKLTHTAERPYVCDICTKVFMRSDHFTRHRQAHTDDKPQKCRQSLTLIGNLKTHMLTHASEKPFICYLCHKAFTQTSSLKTHMRTHTGERPHTCDVCQMQFAERGNLKTHTLTHTGESPHRCDVCHRQFNRTGNLKTHMLTHTGESPHVCAVCHKQFNRTSSLRRHILTHSGQRPYKCGVCQLQFAERGNLKTHMLTHTGERPYKCGVCHKQFNRTGNLKTHMLTHQ